MVSRYWSLEAAAEKRISHKNSPIILWLIHCDEIYSIEKEIIAFRISFRSFGSRSINDDNAKYSESEMERWDWSPEAALTELYISVDSLVISCPITF